MLTATILLPLLTGLAVLALPRHRPDLVRRVALGGSVLTLGAALILWAGFDPGDGGLQWRMSLPWIPSLGARYDVGVGGLSLALILLTALLLTVVMVYVLGEHDRAHAHAFLFLLLATGLIGLFAAQDLLLFYLFFEVGLVPMYFIVGIWGGERRRYAALKFFLYTRAGSLAMLLGFLALYLAMEPHTFSLPAIVQARPLDRTPLAGGLVFLALLLGFGVKLPWCRCTIGCPTRMSRRRPRAASCWPVSSSRWRLRHARRAAADPAGHGRTVRLAPGCPGPGIAPLRPWRRWRSPT